MTEPKHVRLFELNQSIKQLIADNLSPRWITAEISEVNEHYSGHCYLELIEKDVLSDAIVAKAKAVIRASAYRMIKPYFETTTREHLSEGMKVMLKVEVNFHEAYGYSLVVKDINPEFTLGDIARKRALIIQQLYQEGVMDLNKEIPLPRLLQRIAIISSANAAGYTDFCQQVDQNQHGYMFYSRLFAATMQGVDTESSIIEALERIYEQKEHFDAVVIIRGGGATSDLSWFDSYNIAFHCTQFPLPILTGIGHEKDVSVVDMVAYRSFKTPTAVAQFLIDTMQHADFSLSEMQQTIVQRTNNLLDQKQQTLQWLTMQLPNAVNHKLNQVHYVLQAKHQGLKTATKQHLAYRNYTLDKHQQYVQLISPHTILQKGYSLTLKDGKSIASQVVQVGDVLETITQQQRITSTVNTVLPIEK